ncbi:hypothetical protein OXX69_013285, partial [Metschnikowia pulcherrima]
MFIAWPGKALPTSGVPKLLPEWFPGPIELFMVFGTTPPTGLVIAFPIGTNGSCFCG